jgi:hypothetical protein
MTNILEIETFDTSVLADAIFGEDNELIFLSDEDEERQEDLFADSADDYSDEAWMDADALSSIGHGDDEDYGYFGDDY